MSEPTCPTDQQLGRYFLGQLGELHLRSISEHLDACDRCGSRAPFIEQGDDPLLADLRNRYAPDPFADEPQLQNALAAMLDEKHHSHAARCQKAELPARFGRYRVGAEIGAGAMGTVYLAYDTQLDRQVALKVPHFRPYDDNMLRARFLRESRSAAGIHHGNVCQIYDAGEIDGVCFIAMSFVDGQPLSKRLETRQPIPPGEAVKLVRVIALAMQEAHRQGVVHRDLKPGNIIIGQRGEPVVTDFGLASRNEGLVDEARLTHDGMLIGSPAYMSPEQVNGQIDLIGPSCDIYALGVILFELLTGELPFDGPVASVLGQIVRDPLPAPSSRRSGIPPELDAICAQAMAKDPSARFATMADFAGRLDDYQHGRFAVPRKECEGRPTYGIPAEEKPRFRNADVPNTTTRRVLIFARANWLLILLLGISAVLLAAIFLVNRPDVPRPETVRITVTRPNGEVSIDGQSHSREELADGLSLLPGTHYWQIRQDGILVRMGSLLVQPGLNTQITIP